LFVGLRRWQRPSRWVRTGLGLEFDAAWDELRGVFADEPGGEVETAVDAGGHASGGEVLAVFDPALMEVLASRFSRMSAYAQRVVAGRSSGRPTGARI
jgi:hypothetical protein